MTLQAQYKDLKGKKILVTGASRGIGYAIAENLAQQGAQVLFHYRSGVEVAQKFAELYPETVLFSCDLSDSLALKKSCEDLVAKVGTINGLVNNAGISKDQLLLRVKAEDIDNLLNTNLKAAMLLTSTLSKTFLKSAPVSIVHMSSIVGLMGNPAQSVYAASKAGLIGFSKSVAKELGSRQIRSNVVCPGFIETDMTAVLNSQVKDEYLKSIPVGRFGTPAEIAELVSFLLSDSSRYITGEVF